MAAPPMEADVRRLIVSIRSLLSLMSARVMKPYYLADDRGAIGFSRIADIDAQRIGDHRNAYTCRRSHFTIVRRMLRGRMTLPLFAVGQKAKKTLRNAIFRAGAPYGSPTCFRGAIPKHL